MGLTEDAAREAAEKDGYADKVAVVKTSFKANSKASAAAGCPDDECRAVAEHGRLHPGPYVDTHALAQRRRGQAQ